MHAAALDSSGTWRWWAALGIAALISTGAHVVAGAVMSTFEIPEREEPVWLQMELDVAEPEPEVEPEPEPEPEKAPEKPIEYDKTAEAPQQDDATPPEDVPKEFRRIRRISADSVVKGGADIGVPAGGMGSVDIQESGPEDAPIVDFVAAATPPKIRYKPKLDIPQEVIDAEIEGSVQVALTLDAEGKVTGAEVTRSLHPAADAACLANARLTRWKPSSQGETPIPVSGVPYTCTFKKALE